jgi:hypothetical protein
VEAAVQPSPPRLLEPRDLGTVLGEGDDRTVRDDQRVRPRSRAAAGVVQRAAPTETAVGGDDRRSRAGTRAWRDHPPSVPSTRKPVRKLREPLRASTGLLLACGTVPVALATCVEVPELDEDGPPLAALAARASKAVPAVWDAEID